MSNNKKNTKETAGQGDQVDIIVTSPTWYNVKPMYGKSELFNKIDEYYAHPEMLKEFVWCLMNNAWDNGYETTDYDWRSNG